MRSRLASGRPVIGSWLNTASPIAAELMAACGFDFLTVDAEHSAVEVPQAQALFQAIRAGNPECAPLVRLPGTDYSVTKRYMDAGAAGVIAPLVNSPEEAREVVRAVKYPPEGERGVGFCRDNLYGLTLDETVAAANDKTFVCVQIEHIRAVENIDAILAVDGVDAAFIGPYDLTASMGITAEFDHPDYIAARKKVLEACRACDVAAGIHVVQPDPEEVTLRIKEGYSLIAYSLDITMLATSCREALKIIREE
jgi:2-dehydro-3-deoxyglucarate aldolase